MSDDVPVYWGSWKGRIIKAITIDRAYTWELLRDLTGLSPTSLNQALSELYDAQAIYKNDKGEYRVNIELYKEYMNYFKNLEEETGRVDEPIRISKDQQSHLINRIDAWIEFRGLEISLKPGHFFVEGDMLDDITKDMITQSQKEVLIVNPFVEKCTLSDSLIESSNSGKEVTLITRPPQPSSTYSDRTEEYHKIISESGVKIIYNRSVHAKLLVLDRAVAIVSSMNLYSTSTAGTSWEAGIVTVDDRVVEPITNSILGLIEKPESISY
jgi:phosphatidylserine/phosphatidylglycerophosphate/cardiolipin synthase-like enzyme